MGYDFIKLWGTAYPVNVAASMVCNAEADIMKGFNWSWCLSLTCRP